MLSARVPLLIAAAASAIGAPQLHGALRASCRVVKTVALTDDGDEQVGGSLATRDHRRRGLGNDVHAAQAVALEDTEFCVIPFPSRAQARDSQQAVLAVRRRGADRGTGEPSSCATASGCSTCWPRPEGNRSLAARTRFFASRMDSAAAGN